MVVVVVVVVSSEACHVPPEVIWAVAVVVVAAGHSGGAAPILTLSPSVVPRLPPSSHALPGTDCHLSPDRGGVCVPFYPIVVRQ